MTFADLVNHKHFFTVCFPELVTLPLLGVVTSCLPQPTSCQNKSESDKPVVPVLTLSDMAKEGATHYRSFANMKNTMETADWCRFAVRVMGKTNGAHQYWIEKFRSISQAEVKEEEQHEYLLVFCPAASRVQCDVSEALNQLHTDKPVILMVMHHNHDGDTVLGESRRNVMDPRVVLTVDSVFYEGRVVMGGRNNRNAWKEIQAFLPKQPVMSNFNNHNWGRPCSRWILGILLGLVGVGIIIIIAVVLKEKNKNP